ncbi:MAG: shikimate dehydrogenase [Candidatus Methanomethylophilus sp.]|nr:shikimate dehydrogenase [Methanomethylophilus sp.]
MRVCASLGAAADALAAGGADLTEVRLDLTGGRVPPVTGETLVTYRGPVDLNVLPAGYRGLIDIGEEPLPKTDLRIVRSHHDYEGTPAADTIAARLNGAEPFVYLTKGAYTVQSFRDLDSIFKASQQIERRHVLFGMGEFGAVTRLRTGLLKNEFSFGYVSTPTAPGQFSVKQMKELGDDCFITGIVGRPVAKSLSPTMHNAAFAAAHIPGIYLRFAAESLDGIAEVIREYGLTGVNVTVPYKQQIIPYLDRVTADAETIGAVNTVINNRGRLSGENTDIVGILTALRRAGFAPAAGKKVLILGSGGAARACVYVLRQHSCRVTVAARNAVTAEKLAQDLGSETLTPAAAKADDYDLVVNCTPIGMYGNGPYPADLSGLHAGQTVLDMVYGSTTPLVQQAQAAGCRIASGQDMLVGQGAASFELWTGIGRMDQVMREAIE